MTTKVMIDIVGGSNPARYKKMTAEATFNMIVSTISPGVKGLVPYSGYQAAKVIQGAGNSRSLYMSPNYDHMVGVIDSNVYSMEASSTGPSQGGIPQNLISAARVGSLDTTTGASFIAENAAGEICIVDGVFVYLFNWKNNTFEKIKPDFLPVCVTYMDGYFIFADGASNQFRLSQINNGALYPIEYTGAIETKNANTCIAVSAHGRQLFVFGKTVTEVYYNVPSLNTGLIITMPYKRDDSINIDYGCINAESIASAFGMIVWVGISEKANPVILMSTGGAPQILSTNGTGSDGISFLISTLSNPADCNGFLFQQDGHTFYQVTWKTDNLTLVYDFSEGLFYNATDPTLNAHIARKVVYYHGIHYFLSYVDGTLYEMSSNISTYNGKIIPRIRITSPKRTEGNEYYPVNKLEVVAEAGYANDPLDVDLSLSKDGAMSFGGSVRQSLGPLGRRRRRTWWYQLGYSFDWTFQFYFLSDQHFSVLSAYMEVEDQ